MTDDHPHRFSLVGEQVRKSVILMQCAGLGTHRVLRKFKECMEEREPTSFGARPVEGDISLELNLGRR